MIEVYISVGTNEGDRKKHLALAYEEIAKCVGPVTGTSGIYESPSWGFAGHDFYNTVIAVDCPLSPMKLLDELLKIEQRMGRLRACVDGYANRPIDLDILSYGQRHFNLARLTVPHPQISARSFVLQPWAEIAPNIIVPGMRETVSQALENCSDHGKCERIADV